MRLRRRAEPPAPDPAEWSTFYNTAGAGTCTGSTWTLGLIPRPSKPTELDHLRTMNRHATELVDRLLAELQASRALVQAVQHARLRDSDLIESALSRIESYRYGDGSRRRDVLTDVEEILGG